MNILIVGIGRLGTLLAERLLSDGHKVRVMDMDASKVNELCAKLKVTGFHGDGTKMEPLAEATRGFKTDVFIAVTNRDENNLVACEIAKKRFGIKQTIAKSNVVKNRELMYAMGIDLVLDETESLYNIVEQELDKESVSGIAEIGTTRTQIKKFRVNKKWKLSGTMIKDLELPQECVIIYIKRGDEGYIPRGNIMILAEDEVYALVIGDASAKLKKLFC